MKDIRTHQQRKAIEVLCRDIARACVENGISMKVLLEAFDEFECQPTQELVKEGIFKRISKAVFNKSSTTKLTKKEVGEVADIIMDRYSIKFGVSVPFPDSRQPPMSCY